MTINCASKDTGGLSGKTENAGASESWMQINHLMAALREKLDQVTRKRTSSDHVDLGRKRLLSDEQDVETLPSCLFEWIPKIWEKDQPIIKLATGLQKDFLYFGYNLSTTIFCINFCRKLIFKKN